MNLYYLNYNNYYNRIIKIENSLQDYLQYENDRQIGANFSFNDNVNTEMIVNSNNVGNYMIVTDETNTIISRWFILESRYERNGQHHILIRRDVIADNLAQILTAPMFVEKATLDNSDPMIFNSEDMTFNQIKTSETLLKDETGCGWVVGYMATSDGEGNIYTYNTSFTPTFPIDYVETSTASMLQEMGVSSSGVFSGPFNQNIKSNNFAVITNTNNVYGFNSSFPNAYLSLRTSGNSPITNEQYEEFKSNILLNDNSRQQLSSALEEHVKSVLGFKSQSEINKLLGYNGKVLKDSNDKIYKIQIVKNEQPQLYLSITSDTIPSAFDELIEYFPNANNESFGVYYQYPTYKVNFIDVTNQKRNINITADRYHLTQAPYDMFCIPYSDDLEIKQNGQVLLTASKQLALDSAMALSRKYAGQASAIYDVQLLPYCPVRYCIQEDGSFDIKDNYVSFITNESNQNVGIILFANEDTFTFNIPLENPIEINDYKMQSSTDMYRLCSPNYDGVFEFNAAKNYGVSFFNVDATYKPYNPYIHVNPNFNGLYGQDFNDSRGLIVGGDFSLPQATSAWESYQLTTKNYQASFNRQITNMEINNNVQFMMDTADAIMGTISAAAQGAMAGKAMGGTLGGTAGAWAGGVAAGTAAGVAGAIDIAANQALRSEALDYTKDQFGYDLGNIQALPNSLSKTSAFVANNKIFPFLEYYTCTEEEKEALRNKIRYNGMTVMRIGTIQEFRRPEPTYIKGKLIRLELNEDNHIINEIANELNKGVYI